MSERKDEHWLDDRLREAVRGDAPKFDAEAWMQKHPGEYRKLVSRGRKHVGWGLPHRNLAGRRLRWGKPHPTWIAAAAVIAIAIGLFAFSRCTHGPQTPVTTAEPVAGSPAEVMTMRSLRLAYEQGGFDGLDRQLQSTLDEFGPRSSSVSLQELF